MKRRHFIGSAAAGLALGPLTGCATLRELLAGALKQPSVKITGMKVLGMQLDEVATEFTALIKNPNPFGLSLAGLGYAVSLDGKQFAKGDTRQKLQLKARGKSTMKFPVDISLGKTAEVIMALLEKDAVNYNIDTKFRFAIPRVKRPIEIPVAFGGKLPVPKIPAVSIANVAFTNVTLSGVGVRVMAKVQNPNTFELPIDGLHFDVKMNNRSVLRNKNVSGLRLAARKSKNIPFDFKIGLAQLGLSAADLVARPTLDWSVDTGLKSGALNLPFSQKGRIRLTG